MKKVIFISAIFAFISCNSTNSKPDQNQKNSPEVTAEKTKELRCPETTVKFDCQMRDLGSSREFSLVEQDLPFAPDCILTPGDTIRLCKSYKEKNWHIELYYNGMSEVDHCEYMKNAILVSITKIQYSVK